MAEPGTVTVEFLGIPRLRAGRAELLVRVGTVAEVLAAVGAACPDLSGLLDEHRGVISLCSLSINGQRFVTNLQERLWSGDHLLMLSADVGG